MTLAALVAGAFLAMIDLQIDAATVGEALAKLAPRVGTRLAADEAVTREIVALRFQGVEPQDALARLAEGLNATWKPEGETLRLVRTAAQSEAERDAAVAWFARHLAGPLERRRKLVGAMPPFRPDDDLLALKRAWAVDREEATKGGFPDEASAYANLPLFRLEAEMAAALDPGLLARLPYRDRVVFSNTPNARQRPLTPAMARPLRVRERSGGLSLRGQRRSSSASEGCPGGMRGFAPSNPHRKADPAMENRGRRPENGRDGELDGGGLGGADERAAGERRAGGVQVWDDHAFGAVVAAGEERAPAGERGADGGGEPGFSGAEPGGGGGLGAVRADAGGAPPEDGADGGAERAERLRAAGGEAAPDRRGGGAARGAAGVAVLRGGRAGRGRSPAGGVRFVGAAPNAEGVLTEVLLQALASMQRRTYPERYRTQAFVAFAPGALGFDTPADEGPQAAAVLFVEAATGRTTALVELGVVLVG